MGVCPGLAAWRPDALHAALDAVATLAASSPSARVERPDLLYPRPGQWHLAAWAPGLGWTERDIDVDLADLDVDLELSGESKRDGG